MIFSRIQEIREFEELMLDGDVGCDRRDADAEAEVDHAVAAEEADDVDDPLHEPVASLEGAFRVNRLVGANEDEHVRVTGRQTGAERVHSVQIVNLT